MVVMTNAGDNVPIYFSSSPFLSYVVLNVQVWTNFRSTFLSEGLDLLLSIVSPPNYKVWKFPANCFDITI